MNLRDILAHLCLQIGERHIGSPGEQATLEFLGGLFADAGYEVVHESFQAPGWLCGSHSVRTESGEAIDATPCYYSPGGNISAPLVALDDPSNLETLRGCIAFAGRHDFDHVGNTNALAEALEKAGAAAFIINSPYNDTVSTKIVRNPALKTMPVFTVSQRTALRLAREVGKTLHLQIDAKTFPHSCANLVARHKGSGGRKLVVGAHYDTSPGIQGASDNGTGIAALVHLLRVLKPHLGDWDVDFVAFGAEEYGGPGYGLGGYEYMNAHKGEPIEAMLCLDSFGTYLGYPQARVGRNGGLRRWVKELTRFRPMPFRKGSDQGIFDRHGIPTVWFCDGGSPTGVGHFPLHSPQDRLEIVDPDRLDGMADEIAAFTRRLLEQGLPQETPAEIVPLTPEDLPQVIQLVRTIWTMGLANHREQTYGRVIGKPWQDQIEKSVGDYLATPGVFAVKAVMDGQFAGFLSYRIDENTKLGEIGYNGVVPAFGGHNLGRRMLNVALDALRCAGMTHAEVVTGLDPGHAPARAVYEGVGFRPMQSSIRYTMPLSK